MLKFAANLSFLFPSLPFPERFSAAARAGFQGCEFLFPYDHAPDEICQMLEQSGLTPALFNLPPGDWEGGERGLAALTGREAEFRICVETALRYAEATGCPRLHIMAGRAGPDSDAARQVFLENLAFASQRLGEAGITALIEPINPVDMPGYFLREVEAALAIIAEVGAHNLRLQFDCYHRAMMGKDVVAGLRQAAPVLGHVQIAGAPGRHEPGTGTLDYGPIFNALQEMKYSGWIGCEYHPQRRTVDGLGWLPG